MLARMTWTPAARRSPGVRAFTVAWVPTGMNWGVSITPCGVVSEPTRASPMPAGREVKATGEAMAAAYAMNMASPKLKNRYPSARAVAIGAQQRVARVERRRRWHPGLDEGGDQEQQRAARQVEVGDQGVDGRESVAAG